MGNRLTQIATRTGDDGTTGLADNSRISKASERICAVGDVDELNSNLGVLLVSCWWMCSISFLTCAASWRCRATSS
jgi:cob(I)alamin adenosyltransferase